jgi:hypothetical protein
LVVTALAMALTALLLVGCGHDKTLKESPEEIAKEQAAADAHNANTVPSAGDDESPASSDEVETTTTLIEYLGANKLQVGDCVDVPTPNVASVRAIPCGQLHHSEVTARVDLGLRFGFGYPNAAQFEEVRANDCTHAFETYVGHAPTDQVGAGELIPSTEGWYGGDHTVECVAEPQNGVPGNILTGSLRKPA